MKKYPKVIHVTRENPGTNDEYLQVNEDWQSIAVPGEKVTCAVYQFVGLKDISTALTAIMRKAK